MLDIENVNNSSYSKVIINGGGINFEAILQNDLGASGKNNFNTGFAGSDMISGFASSKAELQRTVTYVTGGSAGGDVSGTLPLLTRLNWTGSEKPVFKIQVILVALRDNEKESVIRRHLEIMKAVYPTKRTGLFVAPLGYNPGNARGTVNLKIGKWFEATRLVIEDADFTHSRVCLKSGNPAYSLGQITLTPYEAITYDQYASYYKLR